MQPAEMLYRLDARSQKKMVSIAENYLRIDLVFEPLEANALNRALSADRHKYGRFYNAVGGMEQSGPGTGLGTMGLEFEPQAFFKFTHCLRF